MIKLTIAILLASCSGPILSETDQQLTPTCAVIVTDGSSATLGGIVDDPGMRATVPGSSGNVSAVVFRYLGPSTVIEPLGSGQILQQIGLKLRSADPCNLVYAMWRQNPGRLVSQVKSNPGMTTSAQCGNGGYTTLAPIALQPAPNLTIGLHEMRGEISAGVLRVWLDEGPPSQWTIPSWAPPTGESGVRSDSMKWEWLGMLTE